MPREEDVKTTQVTVPLNIVIFFGIPILYDIILKGRSLAIWGLHLHNIRESVLLGTLISIATFPLAYTTFKVIFNFSTQEFVQRGTASHYFYTVCVSIQHSLLCDMDSSGHGAW